MTTNAFNPWAAAYANSTVTSEDRAAIAATEAVTSATAPGNSQQVFDLWLAAKAELERAKANEAALRQQVVEAKSDKEEMFSGTENIEMPGGQLKIVHKLDYKISVDGDALDKALELIEKSVEGGNVIADRLVNYKPELSVREYKLLNKQQKAIIDACITIKPAAKSVTFEPIKG